MSNRGTVRNEADIAQLKAEAEKLTTPQGIREFLAESGRYAAVRLRDEMKNAPDTKTFRECSKALLEWANVILKTLRSNKRSR